MVCFKCCCAPPPPIPKPMNPPLSSANAIFAPQKISDKAIFGSL
ncbi:hypothetical protein ACWIUD_05925 [Helicobacter sp. 23-1044]